MLISIVFRCLIHSELPVARSDEADARPSDGLIFRFDN